MKGEMRMNDLTVINREGTLVADSRDVAELVGKRHDHLMRDIENYAETIAASENPNLGSLDFFIPSTYTVPGQSREYPCFLLTRRGCDMVANKMTGAKGILFTAAYVARFGDMEAALRNSTVLAQTEVLQQLVGATSMIKDVLLDMRGTISSMQSLIAAPTFPVSPPSHSNKHVEKVIEKVHTAMEAKPGPLGKVLKALGCPVSVHRMAQALNRMGVYQKPECVVAEIVFTRGRHRVKTYTYTEKALPYILAAAEQVVGKQAHTW